MSEEITSFADLGLSEETLKAIEQKGFTTPTPIQAACIPLLLKNKVDVIGQAKTGTGKTATFGLPILEIVDSNEPVVQALILAPTRELAVQDAEEINSLKGERHIHVAAIYGGASYSLQFRELRGGCQVVVGTPGRVLDHLKRGTLNLSNLKFMVLDEADEMLDMGFIDDIEEVLKQTPDEKRTLCFSATMPKPIMKLAETFMKEPQVVKVDMGDKATPALTDQIYYEVREVDKFEALTRIIDINDAFYGIVFCRTKVQCDEVGRKLQDRGYNAEVLHGDLSQPAREAILRKMKEHKISIIVATDVAARGIDIQDLTHVINYTLPEAPEEYIHRIGRTGRAGKSGTAISFVTPREFRKLHFIQRVAKSEIRKEQIPDSYQVVTAKKQRIIEQLTTLLNDAGLETSAYQDIAHAMLDGHDAQQVVSALLAFHYGKALDESQYRSIETITYGKHEKRSKRQEEREAAYDEGFTRLFVARGTGDGLDRDSLCEYLREQAGATKEDFRAVDVQNSFSFVSVSTPVAEKILHIFGSTEGNARPVVTKAREESASPRSHKRERRWRRDDDWRGGRSGRGDRRRR